MFVSLCTQRTNPDCWQGGRGPAQPRLLRSSMSAASASYADRATRACVNRAAQWRSCADRESAASWRTIVSRGTPRARYIDRSDERDRCRRGKTGRQDQRATGYARLSGVSSPSDHVEPLVQRVGQIFKNPMTTAAAIDRLGTPIAQATARVAHLGFDPMTLLSHDRFRGRGMSCSARRLTSVRSDMPSRFAARVWFPAHCSSASMIL